MRDNMKGGALTEVTFYILLSLYAPKHGYAAVSYTHLDVFKRQTAYRTKKYFWRTMPEGST